MLQSNNDNNYFKPIEIFEADVTKDRKKKKRKKATVSTCLLAFGLD